MKDRAALRLALAKRLRFLAAACVAGLMLPWAAAALARTELETLYWLADLGTNWQALYAMALSVLCLGLWALTRNWRPLLALLACALPAITASESADSGTASSDQSTLTIVAANVHFENPDAGRLRALLETEQADIAVIVELGPTYAAQVAAWPGWPHREVLAREDPFGLAIVSRHPITESMVEASATGTPRLRARLKWRDQEIAVTALHPVPPLSAAYARERDETLSAEASRLAADGTPALITGDFNATPWSPAFAAPAHAGFRRASRFLPGTWPSGLHWAGIPIDHVLVSPHWHVIDSRVGPDIGSDHRPLVVRLAIGPKPR